MAQLHPTTLSLDEKRTLLKDGMVILRNAVPPDVVKRAKDLIQENPTRIVWGDNPAINGLYNESVLAELLDDVMGPHTRPINAQVAVTMPGYADAVTRVKLVDGKPPRAVGAHVDGGWAGLCPVKASEIEAAGETLHTWGRDGDPTSMGPAGGAPLWQDRERTLAIGSYTALAAVCLNDQMTPAKGQFGVRLGAHEAVEAFFRMQRERGGPVGGGGPEWPRLQAAPNDGAFAGIMPPGMVASYPDRTFEDDRWPWPELTPALMGEGDAVVALHSLPHTATANLSDDPRMNVLFRIRRGRPENSHEGNPVVGWGVSDHPDRALSGAFLDYPDSYDPYRTSIDKLCDHWSEWQGMGEVLAER